MIPRSGFPGILEQLRRVGRGYLFGEAIRQAAAVHEFTQWCPGEVVRERQWELVRAILSVAYHSSPFYRRRLDDAGWPEVTRERFARMPPLTRRDVQAAASDIRGLNGRRRLLRRSGGSGGAAVTIPLDREAYGWYIAGTWRGIRWWGAELPDRATVLLGASATSLLYGLLAQTKDWLMNWQRIPVDEQFDHRAREILRRIAAFAPTFIYGYPSAVHRLAQVIKSLKWTPPGRLTVIVLTGEPVYSFQRQTIEETFLCPVAEEYGNGELGSMAFQCPQGALHITAENVLLEIDANGFSMADGEGLILATQLHNRVFPLIRYDTGDVGVICQDPCRCGRGLPILRVLGRVNDRVVGRKGVLLMRPWMERLFCMLPEPLKGLVRVVHSSAGAIELQVERGAGSPADLSRLAAMGADLLGQDWDVSVVEVERFLRLPSGKLPYFVRSLP